MQSSKAAAVKVKFSQIYGPPSNSCRHPPLPAPDASFNIACVERSRRRRVWLISRVFMTREQSFTDKLSVERAAYTWQWDEHSVSRQGRLLTERPSPRSPFNAQQITSAYTVSRRYVIKCRTLLVNHCVSARAPAAQTSFFAQCAE